jgi:single-stranded DNA-binding protein
MNQLNSLILEGELQKKEPFDKGVVITVSSSSVFEDADDKIVTSVSAFECECYGNFADFVNRIEVGRGVRLVGHLKQKFFEEDGKQKSKVVIICEHLEVKPHSKKEKKADEK